MLAASNSLSTALIAVVTVVSLTGCSMSMTTRDHGPSRSVNVDHIPDAVPKYEKRTRAGNPTTYVVRGKRYHVRKDSKGFVQRGIASWYGKKFHGRKTSNGETYNMYAMTAAHKTLPIPTYVQVTNLDNGRQVVVRVNDRGPFHEGRIIDLSYTAAKKLDIVGHGTGRVAIRALEPGQPTPVTRMASSKPGAEQAGNIKANINLPGTAGKPTLYLQLGSFISMNNAESLRAQLALNNVTGASILRTIVDRRNIYRVRDGPLDSVEQADKIATRINDLGMGVPTIVID